VLKNERVEVKRMLEESLKKSKVKDKVIGKWQMKEE
jgi:hypothetical protein